MSLFKNRGSSTVSGQINPLGNTGTRHARAFRSTLDVNKGFPATFGGNAVAAVKLSKSRRHSTFSGILVKLFMRAIFITIFFLLVFVSLQLHKNLFFNKAESFIATHSNGIDVGLGGAKPK